MLKIGYSIRYLIISILFLIIGVLGVLKLDDLKNNYKTNQNYVNKEIKILVGKDSIIVKPRQHISDELNNYLNINGIDTKSFTKKNSDYSLFNEEEFKYSFVKALNLIFLGMIVIGVFFILFLIFHHFSQAFSLLESIKYLFIKRNLNTEDNKDNISNHSFEFSTQVYITIITLIVTIALALLIVNDINRIGTRMSQSINGLNNYAEVLHQIPKSIKMMDSNIVNSLDLFASKFDSTLKIKISNQLKIDGFDNLERNLDANFKENNRQLDSINKRLLDLDTLLKSYMECNCKEKPIIIKRKRRIVK